MPTQSEPRQASDADVELWFEAAEEGRRKVSPRTLADVNSQLERINKYRLQRLRRDVKYFRKKLRKMNVDPDLIRELI